MANRIQIRRDSQQNWEISNPVLSDGELGLNYDNNKIKVGNGEDVWISLPYATGIPTLSYNDLNDKPFIPDTLQSLISYQASNNRQFLRFNSGTSAIEFSSDFRVVPSSGVVYPGGTIGIDKVGDVAFSQGTTYYCYQEPNAYTVTYSGSTNWVPAGWIKLDTKGPGAPPQVGDKLTDGVYTSTIQSIEAPWGVQYSNVSFMLINISPAISSWKNGSGSLTVYTGSSPNLNCWARIGSEIVAAPATNTSVGIVGQMAFDENYIYRCVQSNVWKRTALNADTW
jgi:Major tropism determinant N-terminal domain